MADTAVAPDAQAAARSPRRLARLDRETSLMLIVPPVLIALAFGGYVWWRQTADLDETELRQLRWSTVTSQIWQHTQLTLLTSVLVVLIAVPLGVLLTRGGLSRLSPLVVGIANVGQSAPSIGLLVLIWIWLNDIGFWTGFRVSVLTLTLYGLLPVLRNTIEGLRGVDPTLVEAARGVGMSQTAVLLRIELPLALPVIMAGVRTALVLVVGTATLATFINGGGLGATINSGLTLFRFPVMVAGAVLVALLALLVEWLGRVLEVLARPKGV
ncbi:ABC transporter permease [Nocardioides humi]|uniref:ABC transporter permease n=1 Tax=Nocardioides humi TaxID=449461 RepID=A0ABN2ALL9_9ACTN